MGLFDFLKKKNRGFDLDKILQMDDPTAAVIELDTRVNELSNFGNDLSNLSHTNEFVYSNIPLISL